MPTNIQFDINSMNEGLPFDYTHPLDRARNFVNYFFIILSVVILFFIVKYGVDIVRFRKDKEKRKKAMKRLFWTIVIEIFIFFIWTGVWYIVVRAQQGEV